MNPCAHSGCTSAAKTKGLCSTHYSRFRTYGTTTLPARAYVRCKVTGCESRVNSFGYCKKHGYRFVKYGDPLANGRPVGTITRYGYRSITVRGTRKKEHVRIVEAVLGKPLPPGAVVHHINGDRLDNRKENLLVCPDLAYHRILHVRMEALEACGHADWRKCAGCHQYDAPENMKRRPGKRLAYMHVGCVKGARQVPGDEFRYPPRAVRRYAQKGPL